MSYLLDTGFLYSLLNPNDGHHQQILEAAKKIEGEVLLPSVVTTEVAYLFLKMVGVDGLIKFLQILADNRFEIIDPLPEDYARALEIVEQYRDSNIDFVDVVIVALAERLNISSILKVDQRHFRMFRPSHCDAFEILP